MTGLEGRLLSDYRDVALAAGDIDFRASSYRPWRVSANGRYASCAVRFRPSSWSEAWR